MAFFGWELGGGDCIEEKLARFPRSSNSETCWYLWDPRQ